MSFHLDAKKGEIADKVLLPGDPLRAKYIAETFLEDATCYNNVRNMLGYTGTYNGVKVSIQGTGMGIPSAILYIHELINDYGVKDLIRVGTCGALQKDVKIRDVIIAQATTTDSSLMFKEFNPVYFAPVGNFDLLFKAYNLGKASGLNLNVGNIYSSDSFYSDNQTLTNKLSDYGVLGVEMETAGLYYLGSKFNVNTLSLLTVSDHLITGEQTTSEERQTTFNDMITVALDTLTKE